MTSTIRQILFILITSSSACFMALSRARGSEGGRGGGWRAKPPADFFPELEGPRGGGAAAPSRQRRSAPGKPAGRLAGWLASFLGGGCRSPPFATAPEDASGSRSPALLHSAGRESSPGRCHSTPEPGGEGRGSGCAERGRQGRPPAAAALPTASLHPPGELVAPSCFWRGSGGFSAVLKPPVSLPVMLLRLVHRDEEEEEEEDARRFQKEPQSAPSPQLRGQKDAQEDNGCALQRYEGTFGGRKARILPGLSNEHPDVKKY